MANLGPPLHTAAPTVARVLRAYPPQPGGGGGEPVNPRPAVGQAFPRGK